MGNLLILLFCVFVLLAIFIKITEKRAKPMDVKQQQKLSKIIIVLVFFMLLLRLLVYFFLQ